MVLSRDQTYSTQDSSTSDTVPSAAERLFLVVIGAAGADGGDGEQDGGGGFAGGSGANGGEVTGELPVTGGESVTAAIGEAGSDGADGTSGGSGAGGSGGGSPEASGSNGQNGDETTETAGGGGGGGGASAADVDGTERAQAGGGGGGGGGAALEADGDSIDGGAGGSGGGSGGGGGGGGVNSSGDDGSVGGTTVDASLENVATGVASQTSAEVRIAIFPVAPTLGATAQADGSVDISLSGAAFEDTVTLHRSTSSGFSPDANTQIADVTGQTSYTDTGAPAGDEVFYVAVADSTVPDTSQDVSAEVSDITAPPDVAAPALDASVEDQLTATWPDILDEGNFDLQARESGEGKSWGTTTDQTFGPDTTSHTITGLEDGERYDIRLRARSGGFDGAWAEIADVTLLPADTGLTVTAREPTVTIDVTDNADNEDGRRLQRSTDGGSTWTTVDDLGPGTTTLEDTSPPMFEAVEYRSQAYTEHVVVNSATVSTVPVRADEFYAELEQNGSVTVIQPSDISTASVSPEHTGIWGAKLTVAPGAQSALDYALHETRLFYGSTQFFDGATKLVSVSDGEATLRGDGKAIELQEDTTVVTYPDAVSTSTGVPIHDAADDYWGRTSASATVHDYPARTVRTGETFADAPAVQSFTTIVDASDDEPLVTSGTDVRLAQTAFFLEAEDAGDGAFTVVDDTAITDRFSDGEAAELSAAGQNFATTFELDHRVPSDDIEIKYRAAWNSFEGDVYLTLDNQDVGYLPLTPASSDPISWTGSINLAASQTVDSLSDLQPGSHEVGIRVEGAASNSGAFSGSLYVDAIVPYDTGGRFGGFSYTFDNSVSDPNARLSGPEEYPATFDARVSFDEVWHVPATDLTISTADASTSPRLALSPDESNFVTATNTNSLSVDFDSAGYYGTQIVADVRLTRQDSGNAQSPSSGDATQVVDDLVLTADTDDLAIITSDDPLILDADTHLENLQTLHEAGDFRFVMDHEASGLVVESFRRGDSSLAKSATWTTEANGVDVERDTLDYANRLRGTGDGVSTDIVMTGEVNRVGTEIIDSVSFPSITDRAELVAKTRRELIARSGNDELSGSLSIAPQLVGVGYPYTVPEFDNEQANLNAVQFSFGDRGARGELTFGRRRGLGARLSGR